MKRASQLLATLVLSLAAAQTALAQVPINMQVMQANFTADEIGHYLQVMQQAQLAAEQPGEANRLTDPTKARCGDMEIPVADCPGVQDLAWNGGNGCITATEYNYARSNAIAPLCSPLHPTVYIGWCRCGCFEQTSQLLALATNAPGPANAGVKEIEVGSHKVLALTEEATLQSPALAARALSATTVGDEDKELVWVRLANGASLGLTEEHAVLLSSGAMIPARALEAGEHELVTSEGKFVGVTGIDRSRTDGKVYNVLTDAGLSHKGHMVVANGIIVGDIMWQNTLARDLYDVVVRL